MHERLQSRHLIAHTQREYGEALNDLGDREHARRMLARALATYQSLGMTAFVERTRRSLESGPAKKVELHAARRP
jgi:hypothetical protein